MSKKDSPINNTDESSLVAGTGLEPSGYSLQYILRIISFYIGTPKITKLHFYQTKLELTYRMTM